MTSIAKKFVAVADSFLQNPRLDLILKRTHKTLDRIDIVLLHFPSLFLFRRYNPCNSAKHTGKTGCDLELIYQKYSNCE
jgi:hypothetical protein